MDAFIQIANSLVMLQDTNSRLKKLSKYAYGDFIIDIKRLFSNSELTEKIAKSSYLHANGFLKITLAKGDDDSKLRLHIWNDKVFDYSNAQSSAHNHPWSFCSVILCGSFRNIIYQENDRSGELHHKHLCVINGSENQGHSIISKGVVNLTEVSNSVMVKGSSYFEFSKEIHRAMPENNQGITSTLVYQYPPTKDRSNLYLKNLLGKNVKNVKNVIVSKDVIETSISSILNEIRNG